MGPRETASGGLRLAGGVRSRRRGISQSDLPAVVKYIRDQEQHHRKLSFQEEFITFLKAHRIPYDERYIWE